jgi:dTDP-4-amino-4,6-dideoxygalactose transaminase
MIPVFGNNFDHHELENIKSVLDSHLVGTGSVVAEFEERFARLVGFDFGVATNSCTNTFWLLFKALELTENDEVILPNIHFFAVRNVLKLLNIAISVVDTDQVIPNISLESLKSAITSNTKAIIFLEYGGYPLKIAEIKNYLKSINREDIYLILDAANSPLTQKAGNYTAADYDFSIYSFDMNKMLVTGDGGLLLTNNRTICEKVKGLAYYGLMDKVKSGYRKSQIQDRWWEVDSISPSLKLSMNNISAAIGLAQLDKKDDILARRHEVKDLYYKLLPAHILPPPENTIGNVYLFWILTDGRDQLARDLPETDIYTTVKYNPLDRDADTPNALKFYEKCLCLPINQNLSDEDVTKIARSINQWIG